MKTKNNDQTSPHSSVGKHRYDGGKPLAEATLKTAKRTRGIFNHLAHLITVVLLGWALAGLTNELAAQDQCVTVNVYSGFTEVGGGAPYSGLIGSFQAASISFGNDTGFDWHPFDLFEFGADITGVFNVAVNGTYTFELVSDDGSQLFIDGSLVVDNGGPHGPTSVSGDATLTAGLHCFEVQFFECCGGPSGVDVFLPDGVSYACPEAPTIVCPGDITVSPDFGKCTAHVEFNVTASDTCPVSVVCDPPSGSDFPIGTTQVCCTATEQGGQTDRCCFNVTVVAGNTCPLSQGFWRTHTNLWTVDSLTLGTVTYTKAQLIAIMTSPVTTDASVILAKQLIAALLNLANGSDPTPICDTIADANLLLDGCTVPCKVDKKTQPALFQSMVKDAAVLERYNTGLLTPGCTPSSP